MTRTDGASRYLAWEDECATYLPDTATIFGEEAVLDRHVTLNGQRVRVRDLVEVPYTDVICTIREMGGQIHHSFLDGRLRFLTTSDTLRAAETLLVLSGEEPDT